MQCKVGVVIPNYKSPIEYVSTAISSSINQSYKPDKICIVDDNSGEEYIKELSTIISDNVEIELINHNENRGPSACRNTGIKALWNHVDYFCVLDSDDMLSFNNIEECVKSITEDPINIGAIYADYETLHVKDDLRYREYYHPFDYMEMKKRFVGNGALFLSKKALETSGLYDEDMRTAEDYDLCYRIINSNFVILHIPKSLRTIRVHDNNSTNTVSMEIWNKNWMKIRQRYVK